jgi:hypothetical protein
MKSGYSKEAEDAMRYARQWLEGNKDELPEDFASEDKITQRLESSLSGSDPFWLKWDFCHNGQRTQRG